MSEKQPQLGVTADQLQEILRTVISEIRKPAEPTPEEIARKQSDLDMRRMQGELELAKQTARKEEQKRCSHMHGNGTASVAHVENLDMLQCVHCQAKIKRAPGPFDEDSMGYIYDENLFWRLLQARSQTTF